MTGWNPRPVRHIPDDELHAYLDQALSRSQAIEIERHLARCPTCQSRRDEAAALRDRTTAILARLGSPPSVVAPPFEELRARHAAGVARRARWMRRAAVAAGVAGLALGLTVWRRPPVHEAALAAPPVAAAPSTRPAASDAAPVAAPPIAVATPVSPAAPRRSLAPRLVQVGSGSSEGALLVAKAVETDPPGAAAGPVAESAPELPTDLRVEDVNVEASPVSSEPGLAGLWRTVPVGAGEAEAAGLPIVPGLAVVRLRMQPGATGAEVVAVDQQLESGEIVRTIVGPATQVAGIVARDAATDSTSGRVTFTIRQADRMVAVTGPAEAVTALLQRVNGRRRY